MLDSSGRSGSDAVQLVDAATGNTWILEKDEVKDILQGEDSLPSDLAALLQDEGGEDQEALLKGLANLLK